MDEENSWTLYSLYGIPEIKVDDDQLPKLDHVVEDVTLGQLPLLDHVVEDVAPGVDNNTSSQPKKEVKSGKVLPAKSTRARKNVISLDSKSVTAEKSKKSVVTRKQKNQRGIQGNKASPCIIQTPLQDYEIKLFDEYGNEMTDKDFKIVMVKEHESPPVLKMTTKPFKPLKSTKSEYDKEILPKKPPRPRNKPFTATMSNKISLISSYTVGKPEPEEKVELVIIEELMPSEKKTMPKEPPKSDKISAISNQGTRGNLYTMGRH